MLSRALVVLVLLFAATSPSSTAQGQSSSKNPPGYAEAVAQGLSELEAGNFPEAREELRRAHAIFPNARTLRGLGMVEFELRHYKESVKLLEEALASSVKPLDGKLRSETEALLARSRRYLGELHLETDPQNAVVFVDGNRVELEPQGSLLLEVGEHTVEVQATGRLSERRVIQVGGGERADLRVALTAPLPQPIEATPSSTTPSSPVHGPSAEHQPAYKKWWVWTLAVVVAAGAATTAAVLVTRDRSTKTEAVDGTNTTGVRLQTLSSF